MASSVSNGNGAGNNVMMRSKADGGSSLDERNATAAAAASTATGVAAGPERSAAVVTAVGDDSAISFSEEEEEEDDVDGDDEEDDSGSVMGNHHGPESNSQVAFNAAAAAAAAFQRQILANFPMFSVDGSGKLDNDFLAANPSGMMDPSSNGGHNNNNPFESYIAAAAAAAANAEALFRHQQQLTALSGNSGGRSGSRSEKRSAAHDSGTDDNDLPMTGHLNSVKGGSSAGMRNMSEMIQQPSNKRRKQSKPVRISSDSGHEDNPAVTAFLAAQTAAAAAALFNPNRMANGSSEEEEESMASGHPSMAVGDWRMNPMVMMAAAAAAAAAAAGNNESEQEEGQIIRSSSPGGAGSMLDQQLAHRFNDASSARQFAIPPASAYGNWNQQQHMMMSMMAMNRSGNGGMMMPAGMLDDGSSHSSGSPNGIAGSHQPDGKKNHPTGSNEDNSAAGMERPHSGSPSAFRHHMANKYGNNSAGFFPSGSGGASLTFGPSTPSGANSHHPFLFPFLSSSSGAQAMRGSGGMAGSPAMGGGSGSIRIFNHEAYCELCNKEFCNKYFLKTHKANKHGIYVDTIPATTTTASASTNGCTATTVSSASILTSNSQSDPMSVSSSFGPPPSLTYPMHPPPSANAAETSVGVQTTTAPTTASVASYSPNGAPSSAKYPAISSAGLSTTTPTVTTPTSSASSPLMSSNHPMSGGMNAAAAAAAAAAAGLMDFFPMWSTAAPTPSVTTINNSPTGQSSMANLTIKSTHLPSGIINPEAYCELCQKEFCNKYFLKRHKAKMHGIVPPDGSGAAGSSAPSSANTSLTTGPHHNPGGSSSAGGSSHKRHKTQPAKLPSSAVDLIKIPLTLPPNGGAGVVTSPLASILPAGGNDPIPSLEHFSHSDPIRSASADPNVSTAATVVTSSTSPFTTLMAGGIHGETGGGAAGSVGSGGLITSPSKMETMTTSRDSLSLLKIPTPSLSNLFSSTHSGGSMEGHLSVGRQHHPKLPSSSSSTGNHHIGQQHLTGHPPAPPPAPHPQQQLFSPERLRQMGVINTEAFCEICCKEFCNKYFLRTHKFKKHGIGSMPEQPQQQQGQSSHSVTADPSSASATGMVHQHHHNNNNNNKNTSPPTKQQHHPDGGNEQKTPLNLAPSGAAIASRPASGGSSHPQQASDGGMPLSCDLCQRPFQSTYLLHMHRTYFHNQPPPATALDDSAEADAPANNDDDDGGASVGTRHSDSPPANITVKSEPGIDRNALPDGNGGGADTSMEDGSILCANDANTITGSTGITISADLQKLQSMIMELNGSSAAAAAVAAAAASLAPDGESNRNRRCWMDSPQTKIAGQSGHHDTTTAGSNMHYSISGSGGGIVKILNPADLSSDPAASSIQSAAANTDSTSAATAATTCCHLCGNKDFYTPYFLQMHMQNYHGIGAGGGGNNADANATAAMEAAVAAAASQLGLDRLLDQFGASGQHANGGGSSSGMKRSGRSSSSASPAATRSYCQICNKELCNKYFMKTHMLKMHGIHLEASGGGAQIGGVQCDICHKELCSKYFLKVHKQNTHGIGFADHDHIRDQPASSSIQGVMDLSFPHHSSIQQQQQQPPPAAAQSSESTPAKSSTPVESCPLCPKRFKSIKALKAHLSHDHSAASGATSASGALASTCCYICGQQFNDVVALQVHLIKSHASHLMMDRQTPPPPPPVPPVTPTTSSTPAANHGGMEPSGSGASSAASSPSSKTSPSFQCSYCDFNTVSLTYLFAHERSHHPSAITSGIQQQETAGGGSSGHRIQCPLCGQALPLEQFQTHLMAHQLPINFLHTLMPAAAAASSLAGRRDAQEEEDDEEEEEEGGHRKQPEDAPMANRQLDQQRARKRRSRRRYRCSVCSRKFRTRQLCLTHILQRHRPSIRSGQVASSQPTSLSPVSSLVQQQRPLTCPRCGYTTRQPQLLRLHLRTQQCIPVVARNPDLQQLPPYLAVPTSTASVGHPSRSANNNGLLQVQGQHAHRQDFVLQAFLLTQPEANDMKSSPNKNRKSTSAEESDQQQPIPPPPNGHAHHDVGGENGRPELDEVDEVGSTGVEAAKAVAAPPADDDDEEGQSCNFIPSLILLPVNRRIANPLSLTFSLTPA